MYSQRSDYTRAFNGANCNGHNSKGSFLRNPPPLLLEGLATSFRWELGMRATLSIDHERTCCSESVRMGVVWLDYPQWCQKKLG
mgnify:CR=1 FL=1